MHGHCRQFGEIGISLCCLRGGEIDIPLVLNFVGLVPGNLSRLDSPFERGNLGFRKEGLGKNKFLNPLGGARNDVLRHELSHALRRRRTRFDR